MEQGETSETGGRRQEMEERDFSVGAAFPS
jgi:hypothetical protein